MAKAIVKNLTIIQLIDAAGDFPGSVEVPDHVGAGWKIHEGEWTSPNNPVLYTPEEVTAREAELRLELKNSVTKKRWEVETGGLTLPGGVKVKTAIDDKNRITTVVVNAKLAGLTTVNFKADSGWVTISLTDLESIAGAIALHTDACFTAEMNHHLTIDGLGYTDLIEYNINTGWPS